MTAPAAVDVAKAVSVLRGGGVIALPTDTLYALTALASDAGAVARVYAIKGREGGKALPLFVSSVDMAERIAVLNPMALRLAGRFWPGALTIVLKKRSDFNSHALASGDTVALRVPAHDLARAVIDQLDAPVTATSANRSGGPDPVSAEEVRRQIGGEIDFILDAGPCTGAVSSTIVDCSGLEPSILRPGAISEAAILRALLEE
ncbi:MAG TPA: L-threonylcarbamoyladenylate synthase [Dehalococcoidia bacterium]|nr:L-threonylcarbamoyladenylate synthase [Dehalococcoidia bacterium]